MNGMHTYGTLRVTTSLLISCAMLLLGAVAGYSLGGREQVHIDPIQQAAQTPVVELPAQQVSPLEADDSAQVSQQMLDEAVSPEAVVIWQYHMACGHAVEFEAAQDAIGKTRAELEAEYGIGSVESFSQQAVTMNVASEQYCPEHYVLLLEDGVLTVRKTDERLHEQVLLTLDVNLPIGAAAECAEGMIFDSLEDINIYLEGLEG